MRMGSAPVGARSRYHGVPALCGHHDNPLLNALELTGRARTHIVQLEQPRVAIHRDAAGDFQSMCAAARAEGIEIAVFSGFRDFESQLGIWNRKYRGERVLLDENGDALDYASLDEGEIVGHILRWSALPGASRHHWGSELDLYDTAAMPEGYRIQLVPAEYAPDGVFARLSAWLADNAMRHGFFRPYREFLGGVYPEPWHWSYAPVSVPALAALTPDVIAEAVQSSELLGKERVLAQLADVYSRYVLAVAPAPSGIALA
jgi:LAS superfamily LD-carboxypeptidase LdcB